MTNQQQDFIDYLQKVIALEAKENGDKLPIRENGPNNDDHILGYVEDIAFYAGEGLQKHEEFYFAGDKPIYNTDVITENAFVDTLYAVFGNSFKPAK